MILFLRKALQTSCSSENISSCRNAKAISWYNKLQKALIQTGLAYILSLVPTSPLPHRLRQTRCTWEKCHSHTCMEVYGNSCIPRRVVHIICFLPAQIIIIRMVNDWEFKFCFLISNHYAKIREINKLLVVCRERKPFQIHPIKLFWI